MKNFVLTFLVGALVVFGGFGVAWSDNLSCKRTTSSSLAFTSSAAFDSWFPETLNLDDAGFKSLSGKKSMVLRIGERKYQLLPNGKLIAELAEQTGYKSVGAIRYKCNKNSIQVAQSNKGEISKPTKVASNKNIEIVTKEHMKKAYEASQNGDFSTAREIWIIGDKQGIAEASKNLGLTYRNGDGVSVNYEEAFRLFLKASEAGNSKAMLSLATLFNRGQGTAKNPKAVSKWVIRSHGLENTKLSFEWMGYIYELGIGVQKDVTAASNYYQQAIKLGSNYAEDRLTKIGDIANNSLQVASNSSSSEILLNSADSLSNYLSRFDNFRRVTFRLGTENYQTMTAFQTTKTGKKYITEGLIVINAEVCETEVSYDTQSKIGKFDVQCPSGYSATGENKPLGTGNGSVGDGTDSFGNIVQYRVHPKNGKYAVIKDEVVNFFSNQIQINKNVSDKIKKQQTISSDTQIPLITITSASSSGPSGTIEGRVTDNTGVGEVRVDGQLIQLDDNGNFTASTYVPEGGVSVSVEAVDLAGLYSSVSVHLDRVVTQATAFSFDRLNPIKRKAASNPDALALIIGVADYKETNATAVYADSDAKVFTDYAVEKLGVPRGRIKTLVNDGADEKDVLLAVKRWLSRGASAGKTDIYVFFAGHGLASDDGKQMYLLPYDGAPELLEKTAILREELFSDIASANPKSVTVFLDTCYSGTTRSTDMLIASRPIALKAPKQSLPDNFTVMTAAAGDQTAKPLEEAKHGMFSYFLMKGMEGDADTNQDNQITAGELHQYVQSNVVQQSSGSQTPELQGDVDRVLVQFQ
jgi:TPR repeat protein